MRPRLLLLVPVVAGMAACGGTSVGNSNLFSFTPLPSLPGSASPTDATAATPAPTSAAHTPVPKATVAPTAQAQTYPIAILGDGPYFNPTQAEVYGGTVVIFTNQDSVTREVVSDSGDPASFDSGPIAPGASWKYTTSTPGTYYYHDRTRPYTDSGVTLTVVAH